MNELHDVVQNLKKDSNTDVSEAAESTDFDLLKIRKKIIPILQEKEEKNL